jgi:hypothetical protein
MKDYSLSPVFNIRGRDVITEADNGSYAASIEDIYDNGARKYIPIDK